MCNCACRLVLLLVNVAVGIVGCGVTIIGSLLVWGKDFIADQMRNVINPLLERLYGPTVSHDIGDLVSRVLNTTAPIGLTLFIFGLIIVGLCGFGCCGACCNSSLLLKIYIGLLSILVLAIAATIIFYFVKKNLVTDLVESLFKSLIVEYKSITANDTSSMVFSLMMPALECCGLQSGADFDKINFTRDVTYKGIAYHLQYPIPCCKMDKSYNITDPTCPRIFTSINSNIDQGCWAKIKTPLLQYFDISAYIGLAVIVLLLALITTAAVTIALDR